MRFKSVVYLAIFGTALPMGVAFADPDQNVQTMVDAARRLTWEKTQGTNRAQLLVKQGYIVSPVAVVFGYADNEDACEELAVALSNPEARVGTFTCQPVY